MLSEGVVAAVGGSVVEGVAFVGDAPFVVAAPDGWNLDQTVYNRYRLWRTASSTSVALMDYLSYLSLSIKPMVIRMFAECRDISPKSILRGSSFS